MQEYNTSINYFLLTLINVTIFLVIKIIKQINKIEIPMDLLSLRNTCIRMVIDRKLINICDHVEFVHKLVNHGQELNFWKKNHIYCYLDI